MNYDDDDDDDEEEEEEEKEEEARKGSVISAKMEQIGKYPGEFLSPPANNVSPERNAIYRVPGSSRRHHLSSRPRGGPVITS